MSGCRWAKCLTKKWWSTASWRCWRPVAPPTTLCTGGDGPRGGIIINWDDFSDLSDVVPLLARLYPNGPADINHFRAAGGVPVLVRELLKGGLLHEDVHTVAGFGLSRYTWSHG